MGLQSVIKIMIKIRGKTSKLFATRVAISMIHPGVIIVTLRIVLLLKDPARGGSFIFLRSVRRNPSKFEIIFGIITNVLN